MSAITAKASRKMKKYAVLTREPRCFLGSFDFSWEQRKFSELVQIERGGSPRPIDDFITDAPNGLNWVKIGDAPTQGNYITKTAEKIRPEGLSKTREVHPGDLILSNSMSFGKPYIMGIDGCIHDGWLLIRNTYGVFDLTFLCHLLGTPQMLSQYRSLAAGSTVNNLNKELVGNTYVTIPSITEQRVLGAYLEQLDNLITLHQRKCVFLFGFFQAVISMIFTASTFSWEQRKLSELTSMHARIGWQNLRTSEFLDSGDYMLITGTDFNDGAINFSTCHYVERERYEQDRNIQIHNGSILITKDGTLGKVAYVQGLSMPATLNAGVFNVQIKDANNVDERYLFQYLKAPFLMDYVDKKATGGTIKHLNQSILVDFPVILPQRSEQILIGAFFQQLDNLITLHQRECISFTARAGRRILTANKKRNTSSWEQRKFDEVFDCTVPNNTLSRAELSYDEGTVLNVHYGDVLIKYGSVLDVQKDDIPRIPHRCREDFNGALLQDGDVIIADTAEDETTGKACEIGNLQGSAIVSGLHTMVCRPRNRMALGYLGYYLNSNAYHHQLLPLMQGIKVLSLSRSNIQKTSVSYPIAVKEQQLIAYYFSQLDNLITLHQRKPFLMKWRTSDANRNKTNRLVL